MLHRLALFGAATIIATGVAFAQSPDDGTADDAAGGPAAAETAPADDATQMPPMMRQRNPQMGMGMGMGMGRPDGGGPGWRQGGPGMPGPGMMRHGMKGHGHGMMRGLAMTKGAVFAFDRGGPGGKVMIKCADEDSTLECATAVRPILEMMLAAPPAPPAPPKP